MTQPPPAVAAPAEQWERQLAWLDQLAAVAANLSTIVAGLVRDSRGKTPVHGALIQGGKDLATHTGPDGRFRLAIPIQDPKQPAQVTIRAIGYSARSFQVRAGDSVEVLAPMCVFPFHLEEAVVTGSASSSVTNTQHAGVDEGGIVKLALNDTFSFGVVSRP